MSAGYSHALSHALAMAQKPPVAQDLSAACREIDPLYSVMNGFSDFVEYGLQPAEQSLSLPEKMALHRKKVVINLSYFFRQYAAYFDEIVAPHFPQEQLVRIASVGCATGEEPFSLLMQLWERRQGFSIDGYDVNPENLEVAKKGVYILTSLQEEKFKAIPKKDEIFSIENMPKEEASFEDEKRAVFSDEAKTFIRFRESDILTGALPEKYDIIFLQNVLLHFSPLGRILALSHLRESCTKGALLVSEPYILNSYGAYQGVIPGFKTTDEFPHIYRCVD